jgi:serine O-acetyltransferase
MEKICKACKVESMKKPRKTCTGDALTESLCGTVAALRPLYCTDQTDRPDSLLCGYPDPERIIESLQVLIDLLLPGRSAPSDIDPDDFGVFLLRRLSAAWRGLRPSIEKAIPFRWKGASASSRKALSSVDLRAETVRVMKRFFAELPGVRILLIEDIKAAYDGDPAALSYAEVQLGYPGLLALVTHRIAHVLYELDVPVVPRIMSEWTHSQTGADIHPGAKIGHGLFIDHATGVVIGETTEIGNRVKIYQGVTLGARSFPLDQDGKPIKRIKRHPTVEDDVILYANATLLGGDTVIGRGSTVGGNVFLLESVPPNSFVTAKRAELKIQPARR